MPVQSPVYFFFQPKGTLSALSEPLVLCSDCPLLYPQSGILMRTLAFLFFFFFGEINLHTSFLCQLKPSYCILFFNLIAMVRTLTVHVSIHPPPDSPQPHSLFLSCSLSTSVFLRHWFTSNSGMNLVKPISQALWTCFTVKNTFNVLFSNYSTQTQLITYLNSNKLVVF